MATAKQIAARRLFAERARSGAFRRKARKSRKNPRAFTRPSQTTGKRPGARLITRRKKTAKGPKGYFANPGKAGIGEKIRLLRHEGYPQKQAIAIAYSEASRGKARRNARKLNIAVLVRESGGHSWRRVAHFFRRVDAFEYAKAWHRAHPMHYVKVDRV